MTGLSSRRGQPLVVMGVVLTAWLAARALLWSSPLATQVAVPSPPAQAEVPPATVADVADSAPPPWLFAPPHVWEWAQSGPAILHRLLARTGLEGSTLPKAVVPRWPDHGLTVTPGTDAAPPTALAAVVQPDPLLPVTSSVEGSDATSPQRWRVDGWALWREGSGFAASPSTSRLSGYGGSQAGARLRYSLFQDSPADPFAFARVSRALVAGGESELGLGAGLRPLPQIPVSVQAELRITDTQGRTLVRPAVLAVTEFPPWQISDRIEAEAYLQGGYIAGDFATPFADGQARIDRRIARRGDAELRLGAGVWGGAQEGAARLDVGPSASLRFDIREVPVRLSVDYRARVAGDAEPGPGIAVTIVSGF